MKDKLLSTLGVFGVVIWYVLSLIFCFAPLFFLRLPFLAEWLLIMVILAIPFIGEIVRLGLYIWALPIVLGEPIDFFSIIYYISFVLELCMFAIPLLMSVIGSVKNDVDRTSDNDSLSSKRSVLNNDSSRQYENNISASFIEERRQQEHCSNNEQSFNGGNGQAQGVCPYCKSRIPVKSAFCYKCGYKLL